MAMTTALPGPNSFVLRTAGGIGIGGAPAALLRRLAELRLPGGRVLVELEPPGTASGPERVRLEVDGRAGPWFPWARVGRDDAAGLAAGADFGLAEIWEGAGRWFGGPGPGWPWDG